MPNESERFSLGELSAFFSNDQSDGHRLAEFLQKKKGVTQARRCVLADYDPGPMELDVQVVELKNPASDCRNNEDAKGQSSKETAEQLNDENVHNESGQQENELNTSGNYNSREQNIFQKPITTSPLPRAPLRWLPDVRRSAGRASPSDRLRRASLKRLSVGKRTLLRKSEFAENFNPPVCSTPCSSNSRPIGSQPSTSDAYSVRSNGDFESSLIRKDDDLKEMLKAVHETTQKIYEEGSRSPRHTFTIQKGSESGQIVLTPMQTPSVASSEIAHNVSDVLSQTSVIADATATEMPYNNVIESQGKVCVPETQGIQQENNVHTSLSKNNQSLKSSPLIQMKRSSRTVIYDKEKSNVAANVTNATITHEIEKNMNDIMTEDDDELDKTARNVANLKSGPLNLVACSQSTRLRKKRMRRLSAIEKTVSSDTDTEMSVPNGKPIIATHTTTTHASVRRRILNKAPRTPINGEKFAAELERLTNHEILDLRKRNSLHKVFPITKRNSQTALEKRQQLEEKILIEIEKRHLNIQESNDIQDCGPSVSVLNNTGIGNSPSTSQIAAEDGHNRNSNANISKRSTGSRRHKPMPEVVEYRAIVEGVKLRKRSYMDQSTKRALYTKGDSLCEDIQDETHPEVELITRKLQKSGNSQSRTDSPSKAGHVRALEMDISFRSPLASRTSDVDNVLRSPILKEGESLLISPPDPFLDNERSLKEGEQETPTDGVEKSLEDVGAPMDYQMKTDDPPTREPISKNGLVLADTNSETVFKKPLKRAPKSSKKTLNIPSATEESVSDSLRRSKRGHVPLHTWSFQVRFQEQMLRTFQKRHEKKKCTSGMALPIASSTVNSETSSHTTKKRRGKQNSMNPIAMATISEETDNLVDAPTNMDSDIKERKPKQVRVRLKRTKMPLLNESKRVCQPYEDNFDALSHNCQNISVQTDTTELPSCNNMQSLEIGQVLKRAQNKYESSGGTTKEYQEMHYSAADTLVFNDLEGIEYAFYDETATLGYLRFQPHQVKPPKRTSKYNLRFVIINGTFDIAANGESGEFTAGDMINVNSGSLYKIQNISNDVGILLVIKQ